MLGIINDSADAAKTAFGDNPPYYIHIFARWGNDQSNCVYAGINNNYNIDYFRNEATGYGTLDIYKLSDAMIPIKAAAEPGSSLDVKLTRTKKGLNAMAGNVFYDISVNPNYWWEASNSERAEAAKDIVAEYDEIGINAGYDKSRSIVTAYAGDDFAFGEEYLDDGYQITVFDQNSSAGARRINK